MRLDAEEAKISKMSRRRLNTISSVRNRKRSNKYYIPSSNSMLSMDTTYVLKVRELENEKPGYYTNLKKIDQEFSVLLAKSVILHSRTSGIDKLAGLLQYFCMFYGDLAGRKFSSHDSSWYFLVEDSMSGSRKVLRLGKWLKEIERARMVVSLMYRQIHIRKISLFMSHIFAATFYIFDNLIYCNQMGLLYSKDKNIAINKVFKQRITQFKRIKNFSSLSRILCTMVFNFLEICEGNNVTENNYEIVTLICNLISLLNSLKLWKFDKIPVYVIGLLGIISSAIGVRNNWPRNQEIKSS